MQDDLRYITFKQFIYTVDISKYFNEKQDAVCIRFFLEDSEISNCTTSWFDLAWYDWHNKDASWNILNKILSKEILNSQIERIFMDDEINTLCLDLIFNPTESLSSSKN